MMASERESRKNGWECEMKHKRCEALVNQPDLLLHPEHLKEKTRFSNKNSTFGQAKRSLQSMRAHTHMHIGASPTRQEHRAPLCHLAEDLNPQPG